MRAERRAARVARERQTDHRRGLIITGAGGLLLTFDAPLLKLGSPDMATLLFVRGLMLFAALWLFWRFTAARRGEPFINGMDGLILGILAWLQTMSFVGAITHAPTANVVFILAFNPMFAAVLSWLFIGERVDRATLLAIIGALTGVLVIVGDGLSAGTWIGDMLAISCSLLVAIGLTFSRRSGKNLSMSPAIGALLGAATMLFFADPGSLAPINWFWLVLNGVLLMPASAALLALGPRYISAPEVAMFFLLESSLTPVWMWLIFGEVPTTAALAGGGIVMAALALHSIWRLTRLKAR